MKHHVGSRVKLGEAVSPEIITAMKQHSMNGSVGKFELLLTVAVKKVLTGLGDKRRRRLYHKHIVIVIQLYLNILTT